jgi:hypothetical protein
MDYKAILVKTSDLPPRWSFESATRLFGMSGPNDWMVVEKRSYQQIMNDIRNILPKSMPNGGVLHPDVIKFVVWPDRSDFEFRSW